MSMHAMQTLLPGVGCSRRRHLYLSLYVTCVHLATGHNPAFAISRCPPQTYHSLTSFLAGGFESTASGDIG